MGPILWQMIIKKVQAEQANWIEQAGKGRQVDQIEQIKQVKPAKQAGKVKAR